MADPDQPSQTRPDSMPAILAATARAALADPARLAPARRAVAAVCRGIPDSDAAAFLKSRGGDELYCVARRRSNALCDGEEQPEARARLLRLALDGRRPLRLLTSERDSAFPQWWTSGWRWAVALPFRRGANGFGGLVVRASRPAQPDGTALDFLQCIASVAALGLVAKAPPVSGPAQEMSAALDAVVRAQEEERARISRELHDEANQSLPSILLGLKLLSQKTNDPAIHQDIDNLRAQVRQTLEGLHRTAHGLRPAALDELGLGAALQSLCDAFEAETGIQTSTFHLDRQCPCRSDSIDVALYRIVQEALANIARHAAATRASVVLACRDGLVTVQIEDNGKGWAAEGEPWSDGHLGIIGMQERAALLGGRVRIESSPGQGTTVYGEVPADYVIPEQGDAGTD